MLCAIVTQEHLTSEEELQDALKAMMLKLRPTGGERGGRAFPRAKSAGKCRAKGRDREVGPGWGRGREGDSGASSSLLTIQTEEQRITSVRFYYSMI